MRTSLLAIPFALAACTVAEPTEQPLAMPASAIHGAPGRALAGAHRHYTIEALPTGVPSGFSHASKAICAGDGVVGSASITALLDQRPVLYAGGVLTDIGTPAGRVGDALDGNALGEIVGTAAVAGPTPGTSSGGGQAFLYRDGALMELPGIGGNSSSAWAINNREVIAGAAAVPGDGDVPTHAVVWENCVPFDLGTLGGTSFARGINEADVIVGTAVTDANHAHAVVWRDKVLVDLGTGDAQDSQAWGINAAGTIAGFTQRPDRAVIWRGGVMTALPTLGGEHAFALDLNDRGEVVGASTDAAGDRFHAFLYDGATLALESAVDAPGWQLLEARDICNDGRIVGNGLLDGIPRGYILTPAP